MRRERLVTKPPPKPDGKKRSIKLKFSSAPKTQREKAPAAAPTDPASPPDILSKNMRSIARLLGVHVNTLTNWKSKGIEPPGVTPYSLKSFCLLLRPANKLSECRPANEKVRAIWSWAFGATDGGSVNPDDPAHGPVVGWSEERDRQAALKERTVRKSAELELDKKLGLYYDADEVRTMLFDLRAVVVGELSTVQNIANQVRGLTVTQRADLAESLMQWQADAKQRIAGKSMITKAKEQPRAPG